jgi:hypothetical protein
MGWKEGGIVIGTNLLQKGNWILVSQAQGRTTLFYASAKSIHGTPNLVYTTYFPMYAVVL